MKRKIKQYSKPKRPFDKERIEEEAKLKEEFGLKNKKEIWKADAKIKSFREKAKRLIPASKEEQKVLFERLNKIGLEVKSIADVLSLDKRDYLERRLQTLLVKRGLATTPKGARQLIVHKKVFVNGNIVNIPSYIVPLELEDGITLKQKPKKPKKKELKDEESEEKTESGGEDENPKEIKDEKQESDEGGKSEE